jgi:hypothetical protein
VVAGCLLNPESLRLARARACQVEAVDGRGQTALHCAAARGHHELSTPAAAAAAVVELLLQRGARVDARDRDGAVPLHGAARRGFLKAMRLLLDHGAEVNARDDVASTPLIALFNSPYGFDGLSAVESVELLASRGADACAVDLEGRSALNHACGRIDTNAATLRGLLAVGARVRRDDGPQLIDELLAAAADAGMPPAVGAIDVLMKAGAGASLGSGRALAEAAARFFDASFPEDAEALVRAVPRVLAAAQRALDEDEGARVAARLAAAVEADRRDVASGLRALITGAAAEARGAAAERRQLEEARAALAEERRAAAAEREAAAQERQAAETALAQLRRRRSPSWSWPWRLLSRRWVARPSEAPDRSGGGDTEPPTKRARRG